MIHERHNFMLTDPKSPKQHMIRSTGINDTELSFVRVGPIVSSRLMAAKREGRVVAKLDT